MPRVTHVKSARKANPVAAVGESYYWWKFRYGGKRFSLTYPKPSQLTQSAFKGAVYDLIDTANSSDFDIELGDAESVAEYTQSLRDEVETIQSDCQESLDNMPESLQYSPTGELLQERIDACDQAIGELENIEEPDQWQEVRDAWEEHEAWKAREPEVRLNGSDEHDLWEDDEPTDLEDYEEFDTSDAVAAVESCLDAG